MKEYIDFMDSTKKAKEENLLYNNSKTYYQDVENLVIIIEKIIDHDNISEGEEFEVFSAISSISLERQIINRSVY